MEWRIKEFADYTGVSVRTLHYYDQIGLLKPASVDQNNGYRCYNEISLQRMQEILFYRELDFSLKEISEILSSSEYNREEALSAQKELLILKIKRLQRIVHALDDAIKGDKIDMKTFNNSEFEQQKESYAKEAKERWGNTAAYKESEEKTSGYGEKKWSEINNGMNSLMAEFAACRQSGAAPGSSMAQGLVAKWQAYITENYYTCTKEILGGLGQMYTSDNRFLNNINKHGDGTAEYMSDAIRIYCEN